MKTEGRAGHFPQQEGHREQMYSTFLDFKEKTLMFLVVVTIIIWISDQKDVIIPGT